MRAHTLTRTQHIPAPLPEVWHFFSNPANLAVLTPPSLDFRVISTGTADTIYAGQIIEYTVRPLAGIALYWMTEITHVRDQAYFVDEQREGPYRLWHHEHHFREVTDGVEMVDRIHYALPLGILSKPFLPMVRHKLDGIFDYRTKKTVELWGQGR
jgi:ligand-binding SRPBCC domain-containing protein